VATPNQKTVYVLRNGEAAPVKVQIGITDGTSTEIEGGDLHEGDPLITGMAQGGAAASASGQRQRPLRF
jgi:HlyD family secretion protein